MLPCTAVAAAEKDRSHRRLAHGLDVSHGHPAALVLYEPVLSDTGYILGAGDDGRVTLGALLEILLMIGNVGTAVVMFPILRTAPAAPPFRVKWR